MSDGLWTALHAFMAFPYMESLDGYAQLAEAAGPRVVEQEDLSPDFARHVQLHLDALQKTHRTAVVAGYGQGMYDDVERGLNPTYFTSRREVVHARSDGCKSLGRARHRRAGCCRSDRRSG